MDKKGAEIHIVELVVGVLVLCILTLMTFNSFTAKERVGFTGIGLVEKLNVQVEKNVFYGSETGLAIEETVSLGEVLDYARKNRVVNRNCGCTSPIICEQYGLFFEEVSEENNADKFLVSALIMQESECTPRAFSGSSVGLMQINLLHCGNYGLPEDKDECKKELSEDLKLNLETGISILKEYYERHKDGVNFRGCNKNVTYYGWEAALRAYNGLGCNPKYPEQDKFVEEVMQRYILLKNFGNFEEKTETQGALWWKKEIPAFSVEYFGKPGIVFSE